ncbi:MAG TPA: hypothetical protein VFA09_21940 [Ktedonobacteraceae bacterium]|nr:hypothetical protein [Ktedonobacteraceae bacterium]
MRTAHLEVYDHLLPQTTQESFGDEELPNTWKELLGVNTQQELLDSVRDYKDAVQLSQQILRYYEAPGG